MHPSIDILVNDRRWNDAFDVERLCHEVLERCCSEISISLDPEAEVSFVFCDDKEIEDLNSKWRNLEKPTNVLSFPASQVERLPHAKLLGDIIISYETVSREARERPISLEHHTAHMILHGFLHLLGYDHETDIDAHEMENLERAVLKLLGINDPYATSSDADISGRKQ